MHALTLLASTFAAITSASTLPRQTAGICASPSLRKEWRELTNPEKAEYLRAAVCLRNLPKTRYADIAAVTTRMDDLVYTHHILQPEIHFVANFLPWHRWFVQLHEDLLRNECGFTGTQPYWDWSIDSDAHNMPGSPLFDPVTGFGGNGRLTGSNTTGFRRCVVDGPFANTTLTLGRGWPNVNVDGDEPHCFLRDFNGGRGLDENGEQIIGDMQVSAYSSAVMNTVYGFDRYNGFQNILEGLPHAQIHSVIFGDMGPSTSPNEPLFFLHHANVDRAWAKWQGRNATRLADYAGFNDAAKQVTARITDSMPIRELGSVAPVVNDYMDIQSGPLCYTYSSM